FTWPVNSLNIGGRNDTSKAGSGSGGFILAAFIFNPDFSSARARSRAVSNCNPLCRTRVESNANQVHRASHHHAYDRACFGATLLFRNRATAFECMCATLRSIAQS